jgi:hypothetical protein
MITAPAAKAGIFGTASVGSPERFRIDPRSKPRIEPMDITKQAM